MEVLPSVKVEACDDCTSEKYLECPICLIYRCECYFNQCKKCDIKHCFYGYHNRCGKIEYVKTPQENAHDMIMEFEYQDYIAPKGKKTFHCRVNVEKIKCKYCDYSNFPDSWHFKGDCAICKAHICGNDECAYQCDICNDYICIEHDTKQCRCGGIYK